MKVYSITASPAPLKVTPIGNRLYRVAEDVTIRVSTSEGVWVFRFFNGFVTNFRSGGVLVDGFIDQVGDEKKSLVYLVHDAIYTPCLALDHDAIYTPCLALDFEHPVSRLLGDKFLRAGLRWAGMGSFKASCVYNSVRLFGESAYDKDDALTAANSRLFTFEWRDR